MRSSISKCSWGEENAWIHRSLSFKILFISDYTWLLLAFHSIFSKPDSRLVSKMLILQQHECEEEQNDTKYTSSGLSLLWHSTFPSPVIERTSSNLFPKLWKLLYIRHTKLLTTQIILIEKETLKETQSSMDGC